MTAFLRRYFDGGGATVTLATSMASTDTSFVLSAATNWPGTSPNNFVVVIDRGTASEEKILCASNTGTTVTVASGGRGYDGTSATTHSATASVSLCATAIDFDEANQVTHLLGNMATGTIPIGQGTGTLPIGLAVGSAASVLGGGTSPAWVAGSNGQVLGISGGSLAFQTLVTANTLTPIAKSTSYAATNGQFVSCGASLTVTSPTAVAGATFGASAFYAASHASPVTVTAATGQFIGPGIPGSTTSILLGAQSAFVTFISDGTNWYVTGGAQDTGWITVSSGFTNSWTGSITYRLTGNVVRITGSLSGGSSGNSPYSMPAGFYGGQNALIAIPAFLSGSVPTPGSLSISSANGLLNLFFAGSLNNLDPAGSYTID